MSGTSLTLGEHMGILSIPDISGDKSINFTKDEYKEARNAFNERIGKGYLAFNSKNSTAIKEFDPEAKEITMIRALNGG